MRVAIVASLSIAGLPADKSGNLSRTSLVFRLAPNTPPAQRMRRVETSSTRVRLALEMNGITVNFRPGLHVDLQWPFGNVRVLGLKYRFGVRDDCPTPLPGRIAQIMLESDGPFPIVGRSLVHGAIASMFCDLLRGTRFAVPTYSAWRETDPDAALRELQQRFAEARLHRCELLKDVTGISGGIEFTVPKAIWRTLGRNGVEICAGSRIWISPAAVGAATSAGAPSRYLSGDQMYLVKDNERVVQLQRIRFDRGGRATPDEFEIITGVGKYIGLPHIAFASVLSAATKEIFRRHVDRFSGTVRSIS